MFSARWTGSIKGYLGFGKSNSILFRKWVVMQTDLRPIDGLKSFAYVLLYLLMGDIPWRVYVPYESTKILKMHSSLQSWVSRVRQSLRLFSLSLATAWLVRSESDIPAGLSEMRLMIHNLVSSLGGWTLERFMPEINIPSLRKPKRN